MTTENLQNVSAPRRLYSVSTGWEHCSWSRVARQAQSPKLLRARRGMTLIELLVVTVLVSILVTTAIPVLSPNNDSRKIREASRAVNAYLASAQARAIETGRSFGVNFVRLSTVTNQQDDAGVCLELQQVEIPPVYTGFDSNSLAMLAINQEYLNGVSDIPYVLQLVRKQDEAPPVRNTTGGIMPTGYDADLFPPTFFRENDLIEMHGHTFRIVGCSTGVDDNGYYRQPEVGFLVHFLLSPINSNIPVAANERAQDLISIVPLFDNRGNALPSPEVLNDPNLNQDFDTSFCWTAPAPYRVMRQPIPASGEPLQLPGGTAIDLGASGLNLSQLVSSENRFHTATFLDSEGRVQVRTLNDLLSPSLLFTPSGGIQLQLPGEEMQPVVGSVELCIGRREFIPYEPTEEASDRFDDTPARALDFPIDLRADIVEARLGNQDAITAESEEVREIMNQYNWLNLDTRWVVLSGQSGSITSVATSYVDPRSDPDSTDEGFTVEEQLAVALSNAPSRQSVGGR